MTGIFASVAVPTFAIGGRRYVEGDPCFASALAAAHLGRLRPLCQCRPEGVEMYVATAGDGFVVKRMPYTADRHAPSCRYAQQSLAPQLVSRRRRMESEPHDFRQVRQHCSELGRLLHSLWDRAELTHWQPAFEGKRTWATVRRHIMRASENVRWRDSPLTDRLFVPEAFRVEDADAITQRRSLRWNEAKGVVGSPHLLLAGELKRIDPRADNFECTIKHVPDQTFDMNSDAYASLGRLFAAEITLWSAAPGRRLVVLAAVDLADGPRPMIGDLGVMPTTRQWLPVTDAFDCARVERLVRDGRRFVAGQHPGGDTFDQHEPKT